MEVFLDVLNEIWVLLNEMAPYLLLGFLLAGVMHVYVPGTLYRKYLSHRNMKSVVNAAFLGVPLPLCSCGVIPTAMGLRREGASKGATTSFLISTPQTGVDSIIATYSLMGLPFAVLRPIVAFFTAIFGGWLVNKATKHQHKRHAHHAQHDNDPLRTDTDGMLYEYSGYESGETPVLAVRPGEHDSKHSHHHHHHHHRHHHHSFLGKLGKMLRRLGEVLCYAFVEMMEDIGKWLIIGLIVAGLITALVPDSWFTMFQNNSLLSILFVLLFSIPMYLCATGSIPIAVALMLKGLTPGAALVLLMAGPASNAASIMVIRKVLGKRTLWVYLLSIVLGAIAFALVIDYLLPREWFTYALKAKATCCEEGPSVFSIVCTALMGLLLINALTPLKFWKSRGCSCGHDHEGHSHGHHSHEHHSHEHHSGHSHEHHSHEHRDGHSHEHHSHEHHEQDSESLVQQFSVKGMNCNHCAGNVYKAIMSVEGVISAEVSLQDNKATVKGTFSKEQVLDVISSLGFDAEAI